MFPTYLNPNNFLFYITSNFTPLHVYPRLNGVGVGTEKIEGVYCFIRSPYRSNCPPPMSCTTGVTHSRKPGRSTSEIPVFVMCLLVRYINSGLRSISVSWGGGGGEVRWEIPHEKAAMLIVSLRGMDQGFWSHLGCSGPTLLLLAVKASLKLHLKNKIIKFFLTRERFFLH